MTLWQNGKGKRPGAKFGIQHPKAKLTADDIELIRALYRFGESKAAIAKKFDTPYSTISNIINYTNRPHG